jgi:hypothetical protein
MENNLCTCVIAERDEEEITKQKCLDCGKTLPQYQNISYGAYIDTIVAPICINIYAKVYEYV